MIPWRNPSTGERGFTAVNLCRFKAEDFDSAIRFSENIEVFPGVFGDEIVPDQYRDNQILIVNETVEYAEDRR
jgi:hypothetical protein